tara:strand:- start:19052 stop:19858 length:807 start_codon:yes stop_codon:yes gene_type:complete
MSRVHANNYSDSLNGAITNVATSITVNSATGLPAIGVGETYNLTITYGELIEIVTVTDDASSPTLTVTRGVEGTTGTAFVDGAIVELNVTADSLDRKPDKASAETISGAYTFSSEIEADAGISFDSGTNTLDQYEEGTFTPTFTAATPGDLSVTYNIQSGSYTRIGNIVHVNMDISVDITYTTASGAVNIGGLPFTAGDSRGNMLVRFITSNWNWSANTMLAWTTNATETLLYLQANKDSATTSQLSIAAVPSGSTGARCILAGTYRI